MRQQHTMALHILSQFLYCQPPQFRRSGLHCKLPPRLCVTPVIRRLAVLVPLHLRCQIMVMRCCTQSAAEFILIKCSKSCDPHFSLASAPALCVQTFFSAQGTYQALTDRGRVGRRSYPGLEPSIFDIPMGASSMASLSLFAIKTLQWLAVSCTMHGKMD